MVAARSVEGCRLDSSDEITNPYDHRIRDLLARSALDHLSATSADKKCAILSRFGQGGVSPTFLLKPYKFSILNVAFPGQSWIKLVHIIVTS